MRLREIYVRTAKKNKRNAEMNIMNFAPATADIQNKITDYKASLKDAVMKKDAKLQEVGYQNY
jgi:hypothetical protein